MSEPALRRILNRVLIYARESAKHGGCHCEETSEGPGVCGFHQIEAEIISGLAAVDHPLNQSPCDDCLGWFPVDAMTSTEERPGHAFRSRTLCEACAEKDRVDRLSSAIDQEWDQRRDEG